MILDAVLRMSYESAKRTGDVPKGLPLLFELLAPGKSRCLFCMGVTGPADCSCELRIDSPCPTEIRHVSRNSSFFGGELVILIACRSFILILRLCIRITRRHHLNRRLLQSTFRMLNSYVSGWHYHIPSECRFDRCTPSRMPERFLARFGEPRG